MLFGSKERAKKIKDIEVLELSLVNLAATGKRFAITKSAQDLAAKVGEFFNDENENKEVLKKIAGVLPEKENVEFSKHLDTLLQDIAIFPGPLQIDAEKAVELSLMAAAIGPAEDGAAELVEIEKTAEEYKEDFGPVLENSIKYFVGLAKNGVEGVDYSSEPEEDPEEDPETGPKYISKYKSDHMPGDRIIEDNAIRLAKAKEISWPSFKISEEAIKPGVLFGVEHIGKSIFVAPEEEEEEGPELTDKEKIAKLEAQLKERKKPTKTSLDIGGEEEELIEKGEETEFQWISLCSSGE